MPTRGGHIADIDLFNPAHRAITVACRDRLENPTATALTDREIALELGLANAGSPELVGMWVADAVREVARWKYGADDSSHLSIGFDRDAAVEFLVRTGLVTTDLLRRAMQAERARVEPLDEQTTGHRTRRVLAAPTPPADADVDGPRTKSVAVVPTAVHGSDPSAWAGAMLRRARMQHVAVAASALAFGALAAYAFTVVGTSIVAALFLGTMAAGVECVCGMLLVTVPLQRRPMAALRVATAMCLAIAAAILIGDLVLVGLFDTEIRAELQKDATVPVTKDVSPQLDELERSAAAEAAALEQQRSTLTAQAEAAQARAQQDQSACKAEIDGTNGGAPGFGPRAKLLCGTADQSRDNAIRVQESVAYELQGLDEQQTELVRRTTEERQALQTGATSGGPTSSVGLYRRVEALDAVVPESFRILFAMLLASLWVAPLGLARERFLMMPHARPPSS